MGNSEPAVDAQKVFKSTFKVLINKEIEIANDIKRYQGVLEHALSKIDFSVGIGIYMLPSNLNLNIGKKKGYNNKVLVNKKGMKIGSWLAKQIMVSQASTLVSSLTTAKRNKSSSLRCDRT